MRNITFAFFVLLTLRCFASNESYDSLFYDMKSAFVVNADREGTFNFKLLYGDLPVTDLPKMELIDNISLILKREHEVSYFCIVYNGLKKLSHGSSESYQSYVIYGLSDVDGQIQFEYRGGTKLDDIIKFIEEKIINK